MYNKMYKYIFSLQKYTNKTLLLHSKIKNIINQNCLTDITFLMIFFIVCSYEVSLCNVFYNILIVGFSEIFYCH